MINKSIYTVLSLVNLGLLLALTGVNYLGKDIVFFIGVLVNQYFLITGVNSLLKAKKRSFLLVVKFFVLILVFIYAMRSMPEKIIICVSIYTFQLIILALSIKRDSKKIKDLKV